MRRWVLQHFWGQGYDALLIATLYCIVPLPQGRGKLFVYTQELTNFCNTNRWIFPRISYLSDLQEEISKYTKEGDQLIINGGINEYVLSHILILLFSNLGPGELIIGKHGPTRPDTTRSKIYKKQMNGIWGNKGIAITYGGYLPFHCGSKSNHILLWIKVAQTISWMPSLYLYLG